MQERFKTFSISVFQMTRCWQEIASAQTSRYGLKSSCALYLTILLDTQEPVTVSRLAELSQRDKADVSRSVKAMTEKGLLFPTEASLRYRASLRLTELGQRVAENINSKAIEAVELAGQGLSDEDRAAFYRALALISDNMDRLSREGLPE